MELKPSSRDWKNAILTLLALCAYLCGFFIWGTKYSSIYPIGRAKLTGYSHPIWSPDGTYIAFYCSFSYPTDGWDEDSFNEPNWYVHTKDVCIVDLTTRQLKRVTYGRHKWDLIVSPDGSMLSWWDAQKGALAVYDIRSQNTLAKIRTVAGLEEQFWSLDGRRIVSSCGNATLDINSKEVTLTPSMLSNYVVLSPNEKYLAFTQKVRPDGSEVELVPTQNGVCDWPSGWENDKELLVISKDGKVVFKSEFYVYGWSFDWSPDGSLFIVEKETKDFETSEVAIIYVPTGEVIGATITGFLSDWYWSPGSDKAAVTFGGKVRVVEFELSQNPISYSIIKDRTFEAEVDQDYEWLSWSPDEKRIAFVNDRKIWILNLETGQVEPLLPEN